MAAKEIDVEQNDVEGFSAEETIESRLLAGFPATSKFIASDPARITVIFRRFDELAVRNLLHLEARLAALERLQEEYDQDDSDTQRDNEPITTIARSWEDFAVLASAFKSTNESSQILPLSVLEKWRQWRIIGVAKEKRDAESQGKVIVQTPLAEILKSAEAIYTDSSGLGLTGTEQTAKQTVEAVVEQQHGEPQPVHEPQHDEPQPVHEPQHVVEPPEHVDDPHHIEPLQHADEPHIDVPHVNEPPEHVDEPHIDQPHPVEPPIEPPVEPLIEPPIEPHVDEPYVDEPHIDQPHPVEPPVEGPLEPHEPDVEPPVEPHEPDVRLEIPTVAPPPTDAKALESDLLVKASRESRKFYDNKLGSGPASLALIRARWELAAATEVALKEYQEAVFRYRKMLKLEAPADLTKTAVSKWVAGEGPHIEEKVSIFAILWRFLKAFSKFEWLKVFGAQVGRGGQKLLRGFQQFPKLFETKEVKVYDGIQQFTEGSSMHTIYAQDPSRKPTQDLVGLGSIAATDPLTRFVRSLQILNLFEDKDFAYPAYHYVPESVIRTTTTIVMVIAAVVMLIGGIWGLYYLRTKQGHFYGVLVLLSSLIIMFAVAMKFMTTSSRTELFGATAAYAAVLVVFVAFQAPDHKLLEFTFNGIKGSGSISG